MSEFKMLTDEEISAIYNEAKARTKQSLEYGKNRIIKERADEEKRFAEAKAKYEEDLKIFKEYYEKQYQRFLKQEEERKRIHENNEKSRIECWERNKKIKEQFGQKVDESTRPKPIPFTPYKFTFYGTTPREPVKKVFPDSDIDSCNEIIDSFKNIYAKKENPNKRAYEQYNSFGMEQMFDFLNSFYDVFGGGFSTTDLFREELRKEKTVTAQKRNKIEYLTLREHFITMRELQSCASSEMTSYDPIVNGLYGEKLTVFELELMKMKNYKGKILFDLYIPTADGKYVQVDILFISPKGIFVIESKNYSGKISGNEFDEKWSIKKDYSYDTQYNYNRSKKENGFYNPVKQNQKHIEAIQYHFKGIPCFSLIAFSERCKLESIKVSSKTAYVFNRYAMINVFSRIYNSNPDVLSDDMINYITVHLQQFCDADSNVKKSHNDKIRDNVTHDYNNFEYFDDYGDYKG